LQRKELESHQEPPSLSFSSFVEKKKKRTGKISDPAPKRGAAAVRDASECDVRSEKDALERSDLCDRDAAVTTY
jgi:hypothetical protein